MAIIRYSDKDLKVLQVNDNFRTFFPILGNVSNVYFPDVLEQLGLPGNQIDEFVKGINEAGSVLIPQVHIQIDDEERIYSLLSTRTNDSAFSYLNGVQGQFVDRTQEWNLRREREELIEQKVRDQELIVEKTVQLENLATRLGAVELHSPGFVCEDSQLGHLLRRPARFRRGGRPPAVHRRPLDRRDRAPDGRRRRRPARRGHGRHLQRPTVQ